MKKTLSIKEILIYGLIFGIFVAGIVYLVTLEAEPTDQGYYHPQEVVINNPDIIKVGVLSYNDATTTESIWRDTIDYLSTTIEGHSFELVVMGFDDVENYVKDDLVDLVIVNPSVYVNLELTYGASRIVTLEREYNGNHASSYGGF